MLASSLLILNIFDLCVCWLCLAKLMSVNILSEAYWKISFNEIKVEYFYSQIYC